MEDFVDALIECGEVNKAEYIRKYGEDELANPRFIPSKYKTQEEFYHYCLNNHVMAKDAATDIYE